MIQKADTEHCYCKSYELCLAAFLVLEPTVLFVVNTEERGESVGLLTLRCSNSHASLISVLQCYDNEFTHSGVIGAVPQLSLKICGYSE